MEDLLRKLGFSEAMFGNSVEEIVEQGKNTTDYSELLTIIKQLDQHNKRETQAEAIRRLKWKYFNTLLEQKHLEVQLG
ncbi:11215_t:CDS:1, partial [Funneliformis geosporum]